MSAVKTISAVNAGTDTLTATAHGLLTAGRFHVRNVGGALPTGLTAGTDYFAIRVDADNIKVATSSANAIAGTPVVDITGAGSGTNTIEYGLPYCIPDALAAVGGQIKVASANETWAALVAIYNLLVGVTQSIWTSITLAVSVTLASNQNITLQGTGLLKHGTRTLQIPVLAPGAAASSDFSLTTGNVFQAIIPLANGQRITAVRAHIRDSATGPTKVVVQLASANVGAAFSTISTSAASAGNGNVQTITVSGLTTTVTTGIVYAAQVAFNTGTATCHVYGIEVDYDQP